MATPANDNDSKGEHGSGEGTYECHICFEQAKEAVVSMCGHLFCWPCIHRWMESRPNNPTCPVCKSVIDKDKLIPLYGRGATDKSDPREKIPPRPPGHREEPHDLDQGDGMGGINISFGIGAFPFTMMGPMFQIFGNQQQNGVPPARHVNNPQVRAEEQRVARVFIMVAVLVLILIIFS